MRPLVVSHLAAALTLAAFFASLMHCGGGSAGSGATGLGGPGSSGGSSSSSSSSSSSGGSSGSPGGGSSSSGSSSDGGGASSGFTSSGGGSSSGGGGTDGGTVLPGLPARLLVGWGANQNDTWAQKSGVKFDVQWMYLSGQAGNDWYNDFGYGAADGSFLDTVLTTIDGYGFIPGIHLYNIGYGHDQGDPGLLTEVQTASFMTSYFAEFKAMMQRIKAFGKPVIVVLEGDSFGMLSLLTKNDPNTQAAVASTGMPELQGLPDTIAGIGLGYLAIKKSVGATNALIGPDTPYYAASGDIMNFPPSDTDPLASHVSYLWSFFGPLGAGPNATGTTFDFSASCPRAADQDDYTVKSSPGYDGRDAWSASDTASPNTPSIDRYVSFLSLYHQTSGRPWVLHQVPIGNSQHADTPYDANTARSGYKDVLVEYLFQYESPASPAIRSQHLGAFAGAGVVAMLFGFSDDGDMPTNDLWLDGKPFFSTHVGALATAGGFGL